MLVVDTGRKRVSECLVDEAEVCVAAIIVPAGEGRRDAQILGAASTESATAIGTSEPGDADPVTQRKPAHAVTEGFDNADYLVARCDIGMLGEQVPLG
jgi:hypothetical protein